MAYAVMADAVMAYVVMAYLVMAYGDGDGRELLVAETAGHLL